MKATDIEFVKLVGIQESEEQVSLEYKKDVLNHINTIHASAQFTLAETQSGLHLQKLFPELDGKVIPVLRDANVKYRKPALKKIIAFASVNEENLKKFKEQFSKKGRGLIEIGVDVKDIDDVCTTSAVFTWFVQSL